MSFCEHLPDCPFFNDHLHGVGHFDDLVKKKYCLGDKTKCARHMIYQTLGRECVPRDLLPSQTKRAKKLILSCSMLDKEKQKMESIEKC